MGFKKFYEEMTSVDVATVDTKLDLTRRHEKHVNKGKKCKTHHDLNCKICEDKKLSKEN